MTTEDDVDAIFAAPLDDFVAERDALAKKLKAAGDKEAAAAIKAITKPPVSAWAVNQLARRSRDQLEALLDAGEQVRKAQLALLAGKGTAADLREASEAHRAALAALTSEADRILTEAGHATSPATTRKISTTLRAGSTMEGGREVLTAGRLTADVEAATFDALAGATLAPLRARVVEEAPEEEAPEEEAEAPEEEEPEKETAAERRRRLAEEKRAKAEEARERKRQQAIEAAEAKLAELESRATDLEKEAKEAEREAERAARAAEKAREAADAARARVDEQSARVEALRAGA